MQAVTDALGKALQSQIGGGVLLLSLLGSLIAFGRSVPGRVARLVSRKFIVSVDVMSGDPLFTRLQVWLDAHPYSRQARLLTAAAAPAAASSPVLFTPAPGQHLLWVGARPIWLTRERKETSTSDGNWGGYRETITLRSLGRRVAFLRGVLEEAHHLATAEVRTPRIWATWWAAEWHALQETTVRGLDTVVLPDGVGEAVAADAHDFLASAAWYAERGIPWRRGYLFEGPPGTGKTSLIRALAGHLGMDLYICALSDRGLTDERLLRLLLGVDERSILLLEDIDSVVNGRTMATAEGGVTFGGLLNALDGVASRSGMITIVTTNHVERMDPALIRPGRVDYRVTFALASEDQASRLYLRFYGLPSADPRAPVFGAAAAGLSMAEIQGLMLQHKGSADAALAFATRCS